MRAISIKTILLLAVVAVLGLSAAPIAGRGLASPWDVQSDQGSGQRVDSPDGRLTGVSSSGSGFDAGVRIRPVRASRPARVASDRAVRRRFTPRQPAQAGNSQRFFAVVISPTSYGNRWVTISESVVVNVGQTVTIFQQGGSSLRLVVRQGGLAGAITALNNTSTGQRIALYTTRPSSMNFRQPPYAILNLNGRGGQDSIQVSKRGIIGPSPGWEMVSGAGDDPVTSRQDRSSDPVSNQ